MRASMIKNFSADELKALADFYGSPIRKSAMTKFGNCLADAMGPLPAEMKKTLSLTQQQMKAQYRSSVISPRGPVQKRGRVVLPSPGLTRPSTSLCPTSRRRGCPA
jgi:hypothetical protein